MKRCVIKLYDKSTSGVTVVQAAEVGTHHGTPIALVGARIYCPACKSEGRIVATGPRRPISLNGRDMALSTDHGMCNCKPIPRMIASQTTMSQSFNSDELAAQGYTPSGNPLLRHYDEGITLRDHCTRRPLVHIQYRVRDGSRTLATGETDAGGRTERVVTEAATNVAIEVYHAAGSRLRCACCCASVTNRKRAAQLNQAGPRFRSGSMKLH
jgi:uncharacterized Zn-binding protein involved in type VI secretion